MANTEENGAVPVRVAFDTRPDETVEALVERLLTDKEFATQARGVRMYYEDRIELRIIKED
jgi:hypothetical protein